MRNFYRLTAILSWTVILFACQRELHFDRPSISAGTLLKDASGNCDSINHTGILSVGSSLSDSNSIGVTVVVTRPGTYLIHSDTVNGYSFSNEGDFKSTGTFFVRLHGSGTPLNKGSDHFTVHYGSDQCETDITVLKDLRSPALIKLAGAPFSCMDAKLSGPFLQGIPFTATSIVTITVDVVGPGTYNIKSDQVNGYLFTGAGILIQSGIQQITLHAEGKPAGTGTDQFSISVNGSVCTFAVSCVSPELDHFPLTEGSFWVYDYVTYKTDSLVRRIAGTAQQEGVAYVVMKEKNPYAEEKDVYFRRNASTFVEYCSLDKYSDVFAFVPGSLGEMQVMKEGLSTGSFFETPYFSRPWSLGGMIQVHYAYYCIDGSAGVVINGTTFNNVYVLKMYPTVGSADNQGGSSSEIIEYWYAQGVGLIYSKKTTGLVVNYEMKIRRWHVN